MGEQLVNSAQISTENKPASLATFPPNLPDFFQAIRISFGTSKARFVGWSAPAGIYDDGGDHVLLVFLPFAGVLPSLNLS